MKKIIPYILILIIFIGFFSMITPAYAAPQCIGLGDGGGIGANGIKDGCSGVCIHEGNTRQNPNWDLKTKNECDGGFSTNKWTWDQNATFGCEILSAEFSPYDKQADDWYKGENTTPVKINVTTKNCKGTTIKMSITEKDFLLGIRDISEINNKQVPITNDAFSINLLAGESKCNTFATRNLECNYYISFYGENNYSWNTENRQKGELSYNCKGTCDISGDDWVWGGNAPVPLVSQNSIPTDTNYTPLAPLPGLGDKTCTTTDANGNKTTAKCIDTATDCAFGNYLNIIIKIFIGFAAVLAMVMIVIGGVEYMTSELVSSKEAGKDRIKNAILGLLIALTAYTLLNTINPKLLNVCLKLEEVKIVITQDEENFAKTESLASSVGKGYKLSGTPSLGVSDFVKNSCASLSSITVNTGARQASFCAGTNCVSVPINIGRDGVAEIGQARSGDFKTPKGTTYISEDRRIGSNGNAALSRNGYNLGAAFINIGATINGQDRGIGFHGNPNNTIGTTQGCVKMKNDDLVALAPCMKTGTRVIVN